MGRKYGQRGYMDEYRDRDGEQREKPRQQQKGPPKALRAAKDGPRAMKMPGFQEVLRCALCGAIVPPGHITVESQCPKCRADLRSCKNCRHFDTAARFECTQPIPERITKKDLRNDCEFFMARTSIERETRDSGGGGLMKPSDARSAFDNLFKK
jgi:predicted RNA-binding Zn-ribbon protein involved in translation (DUF1610 family)